jgi:flagellar biosynthesis protein FliP
MASCYISIILFFMLLSYDSFATPHAKYNFQAGSITSFTNQITPNSNHLSNSQNQQGGTGLNGLSSAVSIPGMSINFGKDVGLVDTLEILILLQFLSLAPVICMSCFTRIIIVLSFLRQAIGVQVPPNQLLVGFFYQFL